MSYRYWGIIFTAVGLAFFGWLAYEIIHFHDATKQRNAEYYYQPATHPGFPEWMEGQPQPKPHQPNCNAPQSREDADLCAQWAAVAEITESNRLTRLSLQLSIGALIFTIIGTGLLIWTFWETRETARRELRAYLAVEIAGAVYQETTKGIRFEAKPSLVNRGQTPAYNINYRARADILPYPIPKRMPLPEPEKLREYAAFLARDQGFGLSAFITNMIDDNRVKSVMFSEKSRLCVWGTIEYRDIFGREHYTNFFHSHYWFRDEKSGQYIPLGNYEEWHNDAD